MPGLQSPHAGKAMAKAKQVLYIPPQTAPGLGPPRAWNGAWIQLFLLECRMNDELMNDPSCNSFLVGARLSRAAPGKGRPFNAVLLLQVLLRISASILLFANLLTSALPS